MDLSHHIAQYIFQNQGFRLELSNKQCKPHFSAFSLFNWNTFLKRFLAHFLCADLKGLVYNIAKKGNKTEGKRKTETDRYVSSSSFYRFLINSFNLCAFWMIAIFGINLLRLYKPNSVQPSHQPPRIEMGFPPPPPSNTPNNNNNCNNRIPHLLHI